MAPTKSSPNVPKKKRSSGGLKKRKPTAYNKFMSEEMARLKAAGVEDGTARRTQATKNWNAHGKADSSSSP
ncbi:hypothetical protein MSAN_02242200 [Mycena sanguinolenta]|uniref:Uncharacterized protein n=1 Tax=Mycena sanguinolenta TaxID=230812 RepID=A0A8H6XBQ9_9AGAR|nr:hypothetical protein MSAN_02242200 [Mycena sanguinolenta]